MSKRSPSPRRRRAPTALSPGPDASLLDLVDHVLNKGVALDGELLLGVADVDLIYVRLAAVVCAADRMFGGTARRVPKEAARRAESPSTVRAPAPGPLRVPRSRPPPGLRRDVSTVPTRTKTPRTSAKRAGAGPLDPEVGRATDRWNATAEDAERSVAKLVLSIVEFLRKLMERQAIRRMDMRTLSVDEVEAVGLALMRLEQTVRQLAGRFDIDPGDLDLDLGPLGKLS